jgi:hypothetical protein
VAQGRRRTKGDNGGGDRQLRLVWVDLEQYPNAVCCHGTFILSVCDRCLAEIEASVATFEQGVLEGKWDREGFTPAERRALAKRRLT